MFQIISVNIFQINGFAKMISSKIYEIEDKMISKIVANDPSKMIS